MKEGFPQGWEAQRSVVTAHETYADSERRRDLLSKSAKKANQRVYTKEMTWDPKALSGVNLALAACRRFLRKSEEFIAGDLPVVRYGFDVYPSQYQIRLERYVCQSGSTQRRGNV